MKYIYTMRLGQKGICAKGSSINDVMPEGGRGRVRMTNNVEGCMKKHDRGGGVKIAPK